MFSGDFAPLIPVAENTYDHFQELSSVLTSIDLHITNLECPLTRSSEAVKKTGPSMKADPSTYLLLQYAKVNIVCLANNHIFDYGEKGINDTIEICENNKIRTLGIISREDNRSHWLIEEVKNKKIGFLNYCEHEFSVRENGLVGACGYDPVDAYYEIKNLKSKVDYLVVIYHGGLEYNQLPDPELIKNFHYLSDIGADAVIGHHTHVFSGYEIYNGKPLVYSLGNFFFPFTDEPSETHSAIICKIELGEAINFNLIPIQQCYGDYITRLCGDIQKNVILDKIEELSDIIKNDKLLKAKWEESIESRGARISKVFLHSNKLERFLLRYKSLGRLMENAVNTKQRAMIIYNILRNQTLRNVLLSNLKNRI